jgi:hypothetical protein
VDAILAKVAEGRAEVALLIDWIDAFVSRVPLGIPYQFAQVYAWFQVCGVDAEAFCQP